MNIHNARNKQRWINIALVILLCIMVASLCVILACLVRMAQPGGTLPPELAASTGPSASTTRPVSPTTRPSVPGTTKPMQTTVPTIPTQPSDPTILPTAPTTAPTEPTMTPPTRPTTTPTEPTTVPTEPPTEPTTPVTPYDEAEFFANGVFLGDSVTQGLGNYCMKNKGALHGAKIFGVPLYSVYSAISEIGAPNTVSINYRGQKMRPEDVLASIDPDRVFIMLGLNEIGVVGGVNWTIRNWGTLIKNIRSKCPDIEIYIQSGTPIWIGGERYGLTNEKMDQYNVLLEQFCEENGCYFVNVAEVMKDENGGLKTEYCSDKYVHMNDAGIETWIQYLKDYAAALHE